jgi:hypothetical protein
MVRVCDAIMGSGKSSAAITYMNEHPDQLFIYVTPYVDEDKRIVAACDNVDIYEPDKDIQHSWSKVLYTVDMVRDRKNIATTHQAFRRYPPELVDLIRENEYTLIIDEDVDVLEPVGEDAGDIELMVKAGHLQETRPDVLRMVDGSYRGKKFVDTVHLLENRDLVCCVEEADEKRHTKEKRSLYFWQFPAELLTAFKDVYILTYLFGGQHLHHFLHMNDIPYERVRISRDEDGTYRFDKNGTYVPEYVYSLYDKVHVYDKPNLNRVGDRPYSLSGSWLKRKTKKELKPLKNNIYNFFHNIRKAKAHDLMWTTYKASTSKLEGAGYSSKFVPFNKRATNAYGNIHNGAYCVNVFMNTGQLRMYHDRGVEVDQDLYALSTMVQWVWRMAIRNGEEIWLYIPSKRMRTLFLDWVDTVSAGLEVCPWS